MCLPQAQAEMGPTMTEKAETVCAPSPVPGLPPTPASPGPPKVKEIGHQSSSPPRLHPGVPVISLGHTRPPGAAVATTELSALGPAAAALYPGNRPRPLALHYHPHPFLNSLYIGPAGPFGIFPSSRLKRRPSHCELELAVGHQPQKVAPRVFTDSGERRRQQNVNGAFAELRKLLPTHLPDPNPDPAEQERGAPLGHEIHWLPGAQPGPKTAGAPSPTPGLPLRSLSQAPASPSSCVSASLSASLVNK
uniref:BHLH domain-containing protein n=1 Tax=Canis lupus familiaris TaxID=9615 RepID=A0A8P0P3I7_CANLF